MILASTSATTGDEIWDLFWMKRALRLAQVAEKQGEVPVGALIVDRAKLSGHLSDQENLIKSDSMSKSFLISLGLVGWGYNRKETWQTPTGHAELIALQRAAKFKQAWRLLDCTMYVTLEPCVMCAGALVQARISRVVFGTTDPKAGGVCSIYQIGQDSRLNHRFEITSGVLQSECSCILSDFFKKRRHEKKLKK